MSHIIVKCGDSAAGIRPGRFPDSVIGIWSLHLSALSLQLLQRNAPPVTPVTGGVAEWTQQARPSSHWFAGVRPKSQGDSHWCIPDQSLRWGGAAPVAWPGQIPCVPCSWRKGGPPEPQGPDGKSECCFQKRSSGKLGRQDNSLQRPCSVFAGTALLCIVFQKYPRLRLENSGIEITTSSPLW